MVYLVLIWVVLFFKRSLRWSYVVQVIVSIINSYKRKQEASRRDILLGLGFGRMVTQVGF